jgi:hypothetical protein
MTDLADTRTARRLSRVDRVWAAVALLFAGLALALPARAVDSALFTGESLAHTAPFILLSVVLAGAAKAAGVDRAMAGMLRRQVHLMVLAGALAGALSPFCSCGVVPLIAGLLAAGVPLAPVMAFWLASPIMDPETYVLTAAVIGVPFATAKTLLAVGLGLLGGAAVMAAERFGLLGEPLRAGVRGGCGTGCSAKPPLPQPIVWQFWEDPGRRRDFARESRGAGLFLLKWLTLAFALESLMVAYVPAEAVAGSLGRGEAWAIPLGVLAGVPAYLNGFAAVPLIDGLLDLGMAPGAAMAFMIAGGVTSLPAAMAVAALVRWRVFALYLTTATAGALAAGYAYGAAAAVL